MSRKKLHITQQLKLIRLAKGLVVCLLALSFALEFVMLNLISACKEQKTEISVSYAQVSDELLEVTDTISITLSQEYQEFLDYIKKKHEEQNRNKTENQQFTAFNLFFVEKFSFQFDNYFFWEKQSLNVFYQAPFTQKSSSEVFHPPQV